MKFDNTIPQFATKSPTERLPFREAKKETPDRTINAGLPFLIALGTGFVSFVAVGLIAWGMRWPAKYALVAAGFLMLAAMLFWMWRLVADDLLWTVEKIIGQDLSHDGVAGQPTTRTHFELPTGPRSFRMGEIDLPPQLVIDWCSAAWDRRSLAYSSWEPRFALPDGTRGRERYQQFRSWLVQEGIGEEAGGNVGFRICWRNKAAVAFVGGFADMTPEAGTPLLEGDHRFSSPHTQAHTRIQDADDEV